MKSPLSKSLLVFSALTIVAALAYAATGTATPTSKSIAARLEKSPRHQEWVDIKQGTRTIHTFVVYPEVKDKAPAVVLIHEIFGLSDSMESIADQMAENGYIAIAPDLLSGMGPNGGDTSSYASQRDITGAVSGLPAAQVDADLNAVIDYATKLPSCTGQIVVAGFCWGGGKAFHYATVNPSIKAAFAFYGQPPPVADMAKIACPVYGFYAENDARTTLGAQGAVDPMKAAGKTFELVVYPGAGHGFMRAGQMDPPDASNATATTSFLANKKAMEDSWKRIIDILAKVKNPAPAAAAVPATAAPAASASAPK